ncbi:unnamed protein product, partial [Amoebophrya sp. A25]|eukprot:GSA25T00015586001.1
MVRLTSIPHLEVLEVRERAEVRLQGCEVAGGVTVRSGARLFAAQSFFGSEFVQRDEASCSEFVDCNFSRRAQVLEGFFRAHRCKFLLPNSTKGDGRTSAAQDAELAGGGSSQLCFYASCAGGVPSQAIESLFHTVLSSALRAEDEKSASAILNTTRTGALMSQSSPRTAKTSTQDFEVGMNRSGRTRKHERRTLEQLLSGIGEIDDGEGSEQHTPARRSPRRLSRVGFSSPRLSNHASSYAGSPRSCPGGAKDLRNRTTLSRTQQLLAAGDTVPDDWPRLMPHPSCRRPLLCALQDCLFPDKGDVLVRGKGATLFLDAGTVFGGTVNVQDGAVLLGSAPWSTTDERELPGERLWSLSEDRDRRATSLDGSTIMTSPARADGGWTSPRRAFADNTLVFDVENSRLIENEDPGKSHDDQQQSQGLFYDRNYNHDDQQEDVNTGAAGPQRYATSLSPGATLLLPAEEGLQYGSREEQNRQSLHFDRQHEKFNATRTPHSPRGVKRESRLYGVRTDRSARLIDLSQLRDEQVKSQT